VRHRRWAIWLLAGALPLVLPAAAAAATAGGGLPIADVLGIGGKVGDLLGSIKSVVVGGVEWTTDVAAKFIINTLGGLVDLLIPDSWARQATSIMRWVVAVPNYGAQVTTPDGSAAYAFAGVNELRDLFVWIGLALLPLTLVYASTRAVFGLGDHVALPVIRVLTIAVALVSYPWLWGQVAAIVNQLTKAILSVPLVSAGVNRMFEFIVGGGALVGLPLVGLIVMGAAGVALLATIFVKVLMIIVGALVYATGPLMLGLAPTERGAAAARAWLTLALGLAVLPVVWTTVFAIGGLLMNDSAGAGALIATDSDLGELLGGLVLALAAIAAFWLNLKLTRFAAAIVGGQVAGMLALTSSGGAGSAVGPSVPSNARDALSAFGARVSGAARGATGPLAESGRAGGMLVRAGGGVATLAGGGLVGMAGGLARRGAAGAGASRFGQAISGTKAGALATRMARAGHAGWTTAGGQPGVTQIAGENAADTRAPADGAPAAPPAPSATVPAATLPRSMYDPAPVERTDRVVDRDPRGSASAPPRRDWRPPSRPSGEEPAPRPRRHARWRLRRKGR